jgi:dTDP-4-amino-4,6-dideoxygalactose transaminase
MTTTAAAAQRTIPFLDLQTVHRELKAEVLAALGDSLDAGMFVGGPQVEGFEAEFAGYVGTRYAVGMGSGTDALRLAYLAVGVRPGDEVITVPNTFIATTEALTQAGAVLRFVDVEERTSNIAVEQIDAAIGPRTVGIVPVHLYGQPVDLDQVLAIARRHGLWVIEDAAQAQGSRYRGRRVGGQGIVGAFSFYPGKNLGACGEAGAVTTNDEGLARRIRVLREHGQAQKYYHDSEGYNARLDAWQAAVLRIKLRHLDRWNGQRRQAAQWYREALADIAEVTLPYEPEWAEGIYHVFVVHVPQRNRLREFLSAAGIGTGLHYPLPLHLQRAYQHLGISKASFPVTERLAERLLSLPMFPGLSRDDVDYVAEQIRRFYRGQG